MLCGLPHDASDVLLQRRRGARDPQAYDPPDETRRIAALVRDRPLFRGLFLPAFTAKLVWRVPLLPSSYRDTAGSSDRG